MAPRSTWHPAWRARNRSRLWTLRDSGPSLGAGRTVGRVVGVEKSERFVDLARTFVANRRLGNVDILLGDAKSTGLPRDSFDVGHARLVLVNVPEPERLICELVALVRPGGVIASHEADYLPHVCHPPSRAWARLFEIYEAYSRANGIDLFIGRKTYRMFRDAGIVDIQVNRSSTLPARPQPANDFL